MRRAIVLLTVVALVALGVAGCSPSPSTGGGASGGSSGSSGGSTGGSTGGGTTGGGAASGTTVVIKDFAFSPASLEVKVGDTVTFTNEDGTAHTVAGDGWASDTLDTGKSYTRTFDKAGTYAYKCAIHPSMTGEIVVK